MANPANVNLISMSTIDIYDAVYDFVNTFALPKMPSEDCVYNAYDSRAYLNSGNNEMCIITVMNNERRGTNINDFGEDAEQGGDAVNVTKELLTCYVQLDFWSSSKTYASQSRAQSIETIARSYAGVDFFRARNMSIIDSSNVQDTTFTGDTSEYISRHTVTLRLEYWHMISYEIPYFSDVTINYFEDVDQHHPPIERGN